MNIISFAWTTPAMVLGHKTVTRREWENEHAKKFQPGVRVQAWNRSARFNGNPVGIIELIDVSKQSTKDMPDSDYRAEGFEYLKRICARDGKLTPDDIWNGWKQFPRVLWVIRFRVVEIDPRILRLYTADPLRKELD